MYAYAKGDPINHRDARGLDPGDDDEGECEKDSSCGECLDPSGLLFQPGPDCSEEGGGGDDDDDDDDSAQVPCSITAQTLLTYMQNTPAYTALGKPVKSKPIATLAFAQAILVDAIDDNVDPRLLVAVAFVEGKWGGDAPAAKKDNSFGLMVPGTQTLVNFANNGGWVASIAEAAINLANHIGAGQNSVAALYSGNSSANNGGLAAWCVGSGCAGKIGTVTKKLTAQGGSATSLTSPCYLGSDGSFYMNQ